MGPRKQHVRIQWTRTARKCIKALPRKVARGLVSKADELLTCSDPADAHKALTGPLTGYYRITYARYRAVYTVSKERLESGDVMVNIVITFIAAGVRKEHSKDDVYKLAEKFVRLGLVDPDVGERRMNP